MIAKPKAVFPGSFDPFTRAHFELVRNASKFFDITILICQNGNKGNGMFDVYQRKAIIESCIEEDERNSVKVEIYAGLLVDYCECNEIEYIIRGIQYKNAAEELDLSHIYYQDGELKTIFFPTYINRYEHLSSTRVREYIKNNDSRWYNCVPSYCQKTIDNFINENRQKNDDAKRS